MYQMVIHKRLGDALVMPWAFPLGILPSMNSISNKVIGWVLPPLSNSWILTITWLYIARTRTPNIDCYWVEQYPSHRFG